MLLVLTVFSSCCLSLVHVRVCELAHEGVGTHLATDSSDHRNYLLSSNNFQTIKILKFLLNIFHVPLTIFFTPIPTEN